MADAVTRGDVVGAIIEHVNPVRVSRRPSDGITMAGVGEAADAILALFAASRDADLEALRRLTEENTAWRERADEIAVKVGQLRAQLAALTEENAELRGPLTTKVRAADVVMKAIDDAVTRHYIDARSPIADARLDYGDPFKYTDDAFRARAESAEEEVAELRQWALPKYRDEKSALKQQIAEAERERDEALTFIERVAFYGEALIHRQYEPMSSTVIALVNRARELTTAKAPSGG